MLLAKLVLSLARSVEEADTPPIRRVGAEHDRVLKAVTTIEKALIPAAVSAVGVVGAMATHDVVLSAATPIAAAIALAKADQLKEAVKKAREAAERVYEAVRALVEELHQRGEIDDKKKDELVKEIEAGPNVVEIAGVEISVAAREKAGSKGLSIAYHLRSANAFEDAVKALKEAGFEEGVHFTVKKPEKVMQCERKIVKPGYIRLNVPAGLWRLVELARLSVRWAEKALSCLEEIAKARDFYDLMEKHLKPAKEAETIDPRGLAVEDPERSVKAVIKDVWVEWDGNRPRIVVEYEANGRTETFYLTWGAATGEGVRASVRLDEEKAAVLAALTGDVSLKGKKGVAAFFPKHLFALAKIKGVGWVLLRWYAEVMAE
ncbi:PaRep2b protein [Pyrobaculum arsenaticum]|uniref:PaRep2b domain-containing protein n=1 Tax=Pyrobaculum arsenaticum (strain DSM 13514 / JCM 11321 / PZ6) TaxID=340102 RepID=A4WHP2_PYRAR|nr:PaRep2b protein [Pyrobaculum arsenaticum]ABP49909.1 hypothetical protein Pars_0296 [Pyrobaculum arsenaticum DSM 13514]